MMTHIEPKHMMIIALSHMIENGGVYIIGTGLPLMGAVLAKQTHAPDAHLLFETGIIDGAPLEIPTSVSDLRITNMAAVLWPQFRYFGYQSLANKRDGRGIYAGFLGGAQIDAYGNLNSTSTGDYFHPTTRFTGSGGANGIATFCDTIIVMKHERRRFVERVDYVTSPGWVDGPGGRERAGLDSSVGPRAVVTDLGVFAFDREKRMYAKQLYAGVTKEKVLKNTGFALNMDGAEEYAAPCADELEILSRLTARDG